VSFLALLVSLMILLGLTEITIIVVMVRQIMKWRREDL